MIEVDIKTVLACSGLAILAATFGFVWMIHKGWLSV